MNLCSVKEVRDELRRIDLKPCRRFGQNFLIDRNILDIILEAAGLKPSDRVLEVGPGLGVLTVPMAEKCERVICVEKDFKLTDRLKELFTSDGNIELIGSDIMRVNFSAMDVNKCVSNLPYACGSRFLVDLVSSAKVEHIVVMVQEEVARKMCVAAGKREFGLMSLLMQIDYDVKLVKTVKPGCFWPRPEVDSCIVSLKKKAVPIFEDVEKIFIRKFAKNAFSQRRKKIGVILRIRAGQDREAAEAVRCLESKRPEQLLMDEWRHIARTLCGR